MIFRQWQQVLDESKTQSRRLVKEGDYDYHERPGYAELPIVEVCAALTVRKGSRHSYRPSRWKVGKTYAIQPGRGKPAIWIPSQGKPIDDPLAEYVRKTESVRATWGPEVKSWLCRKGYREARIRITEIRKEQLWDISIKDMKAEGVCPIVPDNLLFRLEWVSLWNSINNKKGTRYQDNPLVWVLTFKPASEREP